MTTLAGRDIMIVEDAFYLAEDLKLALEAAGARVIGPFTTDVEALRASIIGGRTA